MTGNARDGACLCQTILIIEDDKEIRETLRDALEFEGYQVETAQNGQDGLEQLKTLGRPCLILLDVMMPVMNGLDFLAACQKDDALVTIPVVMVTAYEQLARHANAAAVVKKPVDFELLLKFITRFCGQPAQLAEEQESRTLERIPGGQSHGPSAP